MSSTLVGSSRACPLTVVAKAAGMLAVCTVSVNVCGAARNGENATDPVKALMGLPALVWPGIGANDRALAGALNVAAIVFPAAGNDRTT